MKKALTLISLLTASNCAIAETTSFNSNALFATSGKQYAEYPNEITSNSRFTAAITEPVYEKAKGDVSHNQSVPNGLTERLFWRHLRQWAGLLYLVGCRTGIVM